MQVTLESIPEVEVGYNGVKIRIRDEGRNVGKLWIGQAHLRWAPGRVHESNAKKISVARFLEFLETAESD